MGAVVLLALIPRMAYLVEIRAWHFFYYPILDSRTQLKWANILLSSFGIGNSEVLAKAPLYSYYLALNQWVMGARDAGLFSAYLVQLTVGALTCGLTYLLGRRVFGEAVGLVAGVLAALYSPGIYREGQLLDTALATALATCFLLALLAARDGPTKARWLGAGLLLGLLGLTRPNLLLLAPVALALMVGWFRERPPAESLGRLAVVFLLGVVLPIVPITGRNYLITGRLVPISTTGGINFYTGNNPDSDGYSPIPSGIAWERTWYEAMAEGANSASAQDGYWRAKGLRFWRQQPLGGLGLLVKKTYLYWNSYEIPNNVSYEWGRRHASVLRIVPFTFAFIGPLGLLGLALGGWRNRDARALTLFVVVQMVAVVSFFVCGRYRMPMMPALCVFAGLAITEVVRLARARRWKGLALAVAAGAGFWLFVSSDLYGVRARHGANRDWYYLGQSYLLANEYQQAKEALWRGTLQDPSDADAYALLGGACMHLGEPTAGARFMLRALDIAPDFGTTAARLANIHLQEGWDLEEPERLVRGALAQQPRNVPAWAALVRLNVRRGELEEAAANLEQAQGAFARWSQRDTRWASMRDEVLRASAEAQAAGVPLPGMGPSVEPGPGAGRMESNTRPQDDTEGEFLGL
jgi:4-amino-4-deoxy-L-arabinose transferase-like glycosyltransferase